MANFRLEYINLKDLKEKYEFSFDSGTCIYSGAYSTIHIAQDLINSGYKILKIAQANKPSKEINLITEFLNCQKIPNHSNVVRIHEGYTLPIKNELYHVLIMDNYEIGDLSQLRVQKASLTEMQKVSLANDIINGLSHIHKHDIIHRDLKPSNILISKEGDKYIAHISDFGVSLDKNSVKYHSENNPTCGTASYSSPEQLNDKLVDKSSDIWSLGIILYQIFINRLPYYRNEDQTEYSLNKFKLIIQQPLLQDLDLIISPYKEIISKCLQIKKEHRYQDASQISTFKMNVNKNYGISKVEAPTYIKEEYPDNARNKFAIFQRKLISNKIIIAVGCSIIVGLLVARKIQVNKEQTNVVNTTEIENEVTPLKTEYQNLLNEIMNPKLTVSQKNELFIKKKNEIEAYIDAETIVTLNGAERPDGISGIIMMSINKNKQNLIIEELIFSNKKLRLINILD